MNIRKYRRKKYAVIAVDTVVFSVRAGKLSVLLIRTTKPELKGAWAVPGGLVADDQTLPAAAEKHMRDKTGLSGVYYEQLGAFGDVKRDPFGRVVSVAYIAFVPRDETVKLSTTRMYSDIRWFSVARLPALAYDHKEMIRKALDRVRSRVGYSNIARFLLPARFTFSELQDVYELVLGKKFDKRNFRRKILALGMIRETSEVLGGGAHRPARLYEFKKKGIESVKML